MPAVIANEWGEADDLQKSALIGLAVTLFVMTIVVNLIASRDRPALDAAEPRNVMRCEELASILARACGHAGRGARSRTRS